MFVRRAARTVRGFLKRGSDRAERPELLKRATAAVVEAMEGRVLLTCDGAGASTPTFDTPSAVLVLPDGDTLIAGSTFTAAGNRTAFARYNADGGLDTAFDGDGKLVLDDVSVTVHTMVLSGGRIVAGGSSAGNKFAVMRFDLDASSIALDPTFDGGDGNGGGIVEVLPPDAFWPDGIARGAAMAVEVKGAHIVASGQINGSSSDYLVARFDVSNGAPDLLFGLPAPEPTDQNGDLVADKLGYVTTDVGSSDAAGGVLVYDDGRILTIGTSDRAATMTTPARDGVFTLVRYLLDGTPDPAFGSNGVVMQAFSQFDSSADVGQAVRLVGDKILAVGTADRSFQVTSAIGIARFHDNGALDSSFGTNGLVYEYIDGGAGAVAIEVKGVAHQADGSIVVAGEIFDAFNGFPKDVALARFNATGARDGSFDNSPWPGGAVVGDAGGMNERVVGLGIGSDGNFVVAAQGGPQDGDFSLLRFASAGSFTGVTDADFGTSPTASASIGVTGGPHVEGTLVELQNVCGASGDWSVTRDGVPYAGGTGAAFSFTPDDDGTYVVTLDVGNGVMDTATVTAGDVAPAVSLGADLVADEGATIAFAPDLGSSYQAELTFAWTVWLGGQQVGTESSGSSFHFVPPDDGAYEVRVLVTDDDGNGASGSVLLTASNVAPTLAAAPDQTVDENSTVIVEAGAVTDPGADAHTTRWELRDATGALVNFGDGSSVTLVLPDDAEYTMTFIVTDDDGGEGTDSVLVRSVNRAPVVDAGADVSGVVEGSPIGVTMAGATDVPADTLASTSWEVTLWGTLVGSGTGSLAQFTPADNGTYIVTFFVTDDDGGVGSDSLSVSVANADPVVTLTRADADPVVRQWEVTLAGSFTDAGSGDTHTVAWHVVDADGVTVASGTGSNVRFIPVSSGAHVVTFTVTDDDGGEAAASLTVNALSAAVVDDVLRVGGTSLADDIDVEPTLSDTVRVRFEGVSAGTFAPARGVMVRAGRAGDDVKIVTGLTRQTSVYGNAGHDTLRSGNDGDMLFGDGGNDSLLGNAGNDVLVGGDGNDLLVGGKGDDLMIGGLGADSIVGNSNDDVIIGGWTLHDDSPSDLRAVHRIWLRRLDYTTGVAALRVSGVLLEDETVFDDGARDVMTGEGGKDLFYGNFTKPLGVLDVITDLRAVEFAADLDLITPLET